MDIKVYQVRIQGASIIEHSTSSNKKSITTQTTEGQQDNLIFHLIST